MHPRSTSPNPRIRERKNIVDVKNTKRVLRTLKLISYLNDWRSTSECAYHLEVDKRTVYRYLSMLTGFGFTVQRRYSTPYSYMVTNVKEFFNVQ